MTDLSVSSGEWCVVPVKNSKQLAIIRADTQEIICTVHAKNDQPNYADAALMSASKNLLDALIEVQTQIMSSKDTISIDELNQNISDAFQKIYAEADV